MSTSFVLILVVLSVVGFLLDAFILNSTTKLFKVEKSNYKTAIKISVIFSVIVAILSVLSGGNNIVFVVVGFALFHLLLQKFYKTDFKKNVAIFAIYTILIVVLSFVIVVPFKTFVAEPFFVAGKSMEPAFKDNDYIVIEKFDKNYQRGDVIIFKDPSNLSRFNIKRIVGLPGEKVEVKNSKITIYNAEKPEGFVLDESSYLSSSVPTEGEISQQLGEEEYYVLGDNRVASSDSRKWGVLAQKNITGKFWIKP